MAEAVSRGDIIVDEVDALNKYAERFSGEQDQVHHAQRLLNLSVPSIIANSEEGNARNDERFSWNQVLVDEVDLVRAAEHGRGDGVSVMAELHEVDMAGPAPNDNIVAEVGEINTWDRSLLVDEVDYLEAVEHGKIKNDGSHIMRLSYENRIRRPNENEVEGQNDIQLFMAESDNDDSAANA